MEVVDAEVLGYCMGVNRAVSKALKEAASASRAVYTLGPLIHNKHVLRELASSGVKRADKDSIRLLSGGETVLIRAHGVEREVADELRKKGCKIVDATCPLVLKSQRAVERFSEAGYKIIFAGDKNHGEVIGIASYAEKNNFYLIGSALEAAKLDFPEDAKLVLFFQTTFSIVRAREVEEVLVSRYRNLEVFHSICPATEERQSALLELCKKVEGVLVIGDKGSANTRRLYETAKALVKEAALIETAEEIPKLFYSLLRVGLTAGASTPKELIEEVRESLLECV